MSGTFGSRNMSKETALMELVERYLQAVRFLLPKKQRHDVDREISEELQSQIEEQQAERGRALDEDELASLLKRFGHPALLALRYQPERHLIGPAVFPLYWFALRFLLATLAVVHLLLPALFFIVSGEPAGRIVSRTSPLSKRINVRSPCGATRSPRCRAGARRAPRAGRAAAPPQPRGRCRR